MYGLLSSLANTGVGGSLFFHKRKLQLYFDVGGKLYQVGKKHLKATLSNYRETDPAKYAALQAAISYNKFIRAAKIAARMTGSN